VCYIRFVTPRSFTVLFFYKDPCITFVTWFYFSVVSRYVMVMNYIGVRFLRFAVTQVFWSMCLVCCPGQVQYEMLHYDVMFL
jgi:hypothetical protein